MSLTKKVVYARVSSPTGTFLKIWPDVDFRGYTKTLNGGAGECVFGLPFAFDYDGAELREGNDVEILLRDADSLSDPDIPFTVRSIFKGYISLIERDASATAETVTVHLLGYYTLLALDVFQSGSQTTLYSNSTTGYTMASGSQNDADIGLMVRSLIDAFNSNAVIGQRIYYLPGDIPDTSTTAKYTFIQKTYREALDILKSLAPDNVYWYVDETGRIQFKARPSTPTHTFVFKRHISKIRAERSLEKIRNVLIYWDGASTYVEYKDAASIAAYGRRLERINDYGLADRSAMDAAGAKFLSENKEASVKIVASVVDTDADLPIEDINPGDTCRFVNFSSTLSDIFRDNMLITAVDYNLDRAEITVELVKSGLLDTQAKNTRKISDISNGALGIPTTWTT